jgi:hypothetical protein
MENIIPRTDDSPSQNVIETPKPASTVDERRARRLSAARRIAGLWANRPDIPADGLDYQRALRSEWD